MACNLLVKLPTTTIASDVNYGNGIGVLIYNICTEVGAFPGDVNRGSGATTLVNCNEYTWAEAQLSSPAPIPTDGTPTCVGLLQTSLDGINWATAITLTTITTLAVAVRGACNRFSSTPALMGKYWRWHITVAASSGTVTYTPSGILLLGNK